MHKVFSYLIVCLLLVGCASSTILPASTLTSAPTALPTSTATSTPEPTPTQAPLEGLLFFDMNGSGLRDEASFNFDPDRLTDNRQPLQADLQKALTDFIATHPDLKDGDLITIDEPGLSGFGVCAGDSCVTTSPDGSFVLSGVKTPSNLMITDPNAKNPALEMRYINKWKGEVTIPAYTQVVDTATMEKLDDIQDCETDPAAMVCKQDKETLLIREQHLNDTAVFKLSDGFSITPDKPNEIGIMQGFLTLPIQRETEYYIWSYVDLDYRVGFVKDWKNENLWAIDAFTRIESPYARPGVSDQHQGVDYNLSIGNYVLAMAQGEVMSIREPSDKDTRQIVLHYKFGEEYQTNLGHNSAHLVKERQLVYRGQIIALTGNDVFGPYTCQPHIHLSFWRWPDDINAPCVPYPNGDCAYRVTDPWRDLSNPTSISYWTKDNDPQFSR